MHIFLAENAKIITKTKIAKTPFAKKKKEAENL